MVTIIDGEIVQDDDPRAQAYKQRHRRPESSNNQRGTVGQGSFSSRQRPNNGPSVLGQGSILDQINNKLLAAGFPRWNFGETVVEPIVSVILLLVLVMFGLKAGIVFVIISFMVKKMSQRR